MVSTSVFHSERLRNASPTAPPRHWNAQIVTRPWMVDLSLLFVAIVWGTSYLATKTVIAAVPVFVFLFARFGFTALLLLPFVWSTLRKASPKMWRAGGVLGVLLFAIFVAETLGVTHTSAADAGFLIALNVVFTPIVEGMVQRRWPGWGLAGAVLLGLVGTALLTAMGSTTLSAGNALVVLAALLRAVQVTVSHRLTDGQQWDSTALTAVQLSVVAVLTGGASFWSLSGSHVLRAANPWVIGSLVAYLAVLSTFVAFYVQLVAIRRTSPSRVALLLGTEPLWAALTAVGLGGETLPLREWAGGGILVAATFWGRWTESRGRAEPGDGNR